MTHTKISDLPVGDASFYYGSLRSDEDEDLIGTWYRVSDFDGLARSDASSFTIGNKGYLVCGYDGKKRLSDLWEYDMEQDFWTQKASMPGTARNSAVAFYGKRISGNRYDGENYLKDFWEYDQLQTSGHKAGRLSGSGRYGASCFRCRDKGI